MDVVPHLDANINDHSQVDDSIKQEGVTINASGNATINSNSGNGRTSKVGVSDLFKVLGVSIMCDIALGILLYFGQASTMRKIESLRNEAEKTHMELERQAKDGTVWMLRYDIIRTIDLFEAKGVMTAKDYTRLKDEYQYYRGIGGNHDVQERFDQFTAKLLAGEVKIAPMTK